MVSLATLMNLRGETTLSKGSVRRAPSLVNSPPSNLIRRQALARLLVDFILQLLKRLLARLHIQSLIFRLAEDFGEIGGNEAAENEVGVGDGGLSSLAIAGGTRVRADRLGADDEKAVAPEQPSAKGRRVSLDCGGGKGSGDSSSSACGNSLNVELRRLHRYACSRRLHHNFVSSVEARNVGRGSSLRNRGGVSALHYQE